MRVLHIWLINIYHEMGKNCMVATNSITLRLFGNAALSPTFILSVIIDVFKVHPSVN